MTRRQRISKALKRNGQVSDSLLETMEIELRALWTVMDAATRWQICRAAANETTLLHLIDAYHKGEHNG